jgi:hypothetical protein
MDVSQQINVGIQPRWKDFKNWSVAYNFQTWYPTALMGGGNDVMNANHAGTGNCNDSLATRIPVIQWPAVISFLLLMSVVGWTVARAEVRGATIPLWGSTHFLKRFIAAAVWGVCANRGWKQQGTDRY